MQAEHPRTRSTEAVRKAGPRRLAAVMLTDIVGYTALAQRNEPLALELLDQHRVLLRACLRKHGGREIKTMGDAFLVEFASALEAVNCALGIQKALHESNISRRPKTAIALRIGVHVGEVVHAKGDIYGDAVNLASRIESLAGAGEIFISQQVYDHVRNKIESPIGYLGKRTMKNVELPMDIYRVVFPAAQTSSVAHAVPQKHRIAVLPFASISPDPSDEYFADGLTEELISVVSKIGGLRVTSRTSVMRYKGKEKTIREIAQELNVGAILEGSVRKAGNKLRIMVQLIDVENDEHLWSQSYDRELRDVFDIQGDVARSVVDALEIHLLAKEKQQIDKKPTSSIDAYALYLKGLHSRGKGTEEGIKKAITYFEEARSRDPRFAAVLAALADCYATLGIDSQAAPRESFARARELVMEALKLDDSIAEAHATLGLILENDSLDFHGAEVEFRRALGLNPSYGKVCRSYGAHLACLGRLDEAITEIRRAQELNPLALDVNECAAVIFNCANQYDEAIDACQRMLELNPNHFPALQFLAETYLNKSKFEEAVGVLQSALTISNGAPTVKGRLGYAYARSGKAPEAEKLLRELMEDAKRGYVPPVAVAMVHCGLGDSDRAMEWLERAYEERPDHLLSLKLRPIWASLRPDPRFITLIRKLGLEGGE